MDPALRKQVEREMSVERLVNFSGDEFNVKQITDELEHMADPAERAAVLEEYEKRSGHTLQTEIQLNTDEDDHYRHATDQLLSEERTRAEDKLAEMAKKDPEAFAARKKKAEEAARKLVAELSKSDTDKKKVFDTLGFTDGPEDTELIRQAFREIAPEQDGLFNRIDHSMGGDNEREAIADLDMSDKRRLKQAAAAMRNSFTGTFHDNDRDRMKQMLHRLSPDEIKEMRDNPDQYGDILTDVQKTMHGADDSIVRAYIGGQHDLATGLQLAEDISGNSTHMMHAADCDKLDGDALFSKLEKMSPRERQAAIKAYDAMMPGMVSLEEQMKRRFATEDDNYDLDRGEALLEGNIAKAKAAEAMDAIDRKGTHIDDLEDAMSDPDLDPALAKSKDSARVKAHQEALARRADILEYVEGYGKGTLQELAYDEDKLAVGKDNRVAFDEIMATGQVGFGIKMQRAIDDDDTEKGKDLILHASDEDLALARQQFPHLEDGKDFDYAIRKEWGPTKYLQNGIGSYTEVIDEDGDKNGNFIQMEAVLQNGSREKWSPKERASVNLQAYEADREDPTMKEMLGETWAGGQYDYAIRREMVAAEEGMSGEEFAFHAENTEAAGEAYGEQKEADAEEFISHLKMLVNVVTLVVAPELLPLITPLMSAAAIGYKESKLGKHYKGENADIKGLGVDCALSLTGVAGESLIGMRQAANVAKGVEALEGEARAASTLVREAEGAATAGGEAEVMAGVTKAHAIADEAEVASKEVIAAKSEAESAAHAAEGAKGAKGAAGGAKLGTEVEEKIEKVKELAEKAARKQRIALEATKTAGDSVARGAIEGKSWDEIVQGVALSELGLGATKLAEHVVGGVLDKLKPGAAGAAEGEVEHGAAGAAHAAEGEVEHGAAGAAHAAEGEVEHGAAGAAGAAEGARRTPLHQTFGGRNLIVGAAKSAAALPFDAAASGSDDFVGIFFEKWASEAAATAHEVMGERHANAKADHAAEKATEHLEEKLTGKPAQHGDEPAANRHAAEERMPQREEDLRRPPPVEERAGEEPAARRYVASQEEQDEVAALRALVSDDEVNGLRREGEQRRRDQGGVLSVEDARELHARGARHGLSTSELPRASTAEEVLLARGLSEDELKLYKESLGADQQSHIGDAEARDLSKEQWRSFQPNHDESITGVKRMPLDAAHISAVLKANCILYQDFVEGATAVKVVPESAVGGLLHGRSERGAPKLAGDVGLARNSEGMTAAEKVQYLGLDYQGSNYVKGEGTSKAVSPDSARRIYQVEQKLGSEHVDAAKVVLGVNMYDHALGEAMRLAALKAKDPSVQIPKLLELDEDGNLRHVAEPRVRDNAESP